jgi:hypothetical protein
MTAGSAADAGGLPRSVAGTAGKIRQPAAREVEAWSREKVHDCSGSEEAGGGHHEFGGLDGERGSGRRGAIGCPSLDPGFDR